MPFRRTFRSACQRLDSAIRTFGEDVTAAVGTSGVGYARRSLPICQVRFTTAHLLLYVPIKREDVAAWRDAVMAVSKNKSYPGTQYRLAEVNDVEEAIGLVRLQYDLV
jgi:hypothetical protein